VLGEALLCPAETEGDVSSQPEHGPAPRGGAVSVPIGRSAAGAQKIPQRQRFVWALQLHTGFRRSSRAVLQSDQGSLYEH